MIAQRATTAAPVIRARAEQLPFADGSFDAMLGVLTLHHWADLARGLAQCRRGLPASPESIETGATTMQLQANVFDVWVFRRRSSEVEFLLLRTSVEKATRYFNGGRFWQIPSNLVNDGESITDAISRILDHYGLQPKTIWAGEHAYLIYNRRFAKMQAIGVFAAEVEDAIVRLDTVEHSEFAWLPFEDCLDRLHYRGLKDGLRSVHEYVTGVEEPAKELCLYAAPGR